MPAILATLALGCLFCVVVALFLACCVSIAFVLRWIVPSVELGAGAILAAIGLLSAHRVVAWILEKGPNRTGPPDEEHGVTEAEAIPPIIVNVRGRPPRRRKPRPGDSHG